jgi:hypothetical protein
MIEGQEVFLDLSVPHDQANSPMVALERRAQQGQGWPEATAGGGAKRP